MFWLRLEALENVWVIFGDLIKIKKIEVSSASWLINIY